MNDLSDYTAPPRTFTARDPQGFAADVDRHEIVMHRGNLDSSWYLTDSELVELAAVVNARLVAETQP